MRNILLIAKNMIKMKFRKKSSFFVYIIIPVLIVVVSSLVHNSTTGTLNIGIVDNNQSVLSKDFVSHIKIGEKFNVVNMNQGEMKDYITTSKVDCAVIIPKNYDKNLYSGNENKIDIVSVRGSDKTAWIKSYINSYIGDLNSIAIASKGDDVKFHKIYDEYKKSKIKVKSLKLQDEVIGKTTVGASIGMLIMFIMFQACNTAQMILEDKRNRTFYRITSTPVTSKEYLLSNMLCSFIIIMTQIVLVTLILYKFMNVNTGLIVQNFMIILILVALISISIGVAIVSFANSTDSNNAIINLVVTPSCMLSGCFWPISIMPKTMQKLSYIFPQRWIIKMVEKLQMGKEFKSLTIELIIIFGFIIVIFLIAAFNFKRRKNVMNFN